MQRRSITLSALLTLGLSGLLLAAEPAPRVRAERPRLFIRAKAWDGPSVEKVKEWMSRPEYQKRLAAGKLGSPVGQALLYRLTGDEAAGQAAVTALKAFKISGSSPSYSGIAAQQMAALYDWLHDHPDFDAEARKSAVAQLERWGDGFVAFLSDKGAPTPFYSRISGAVAGLTAIGLALHGDSPKADGYVAFAADFLRNKIGTIRQMEDGAGAGGTYSFHHEFTDLANAVAAWRSATDWDAAAWIKAHQGDWLERQLLFHLYLVYPNGWFPKYGDLWGGGHTDKTQLCMHVAAITSMVRNGFGRAYLDQVYQRWGAADFHVEYAWEWFVFNDPTVPARPLSDLPRAAVFSPNLHGTVIWRSGWGPDDTVIHFKSGEAVDVHTTCDQGRFEIFRGAPLAIKNGSYSDDVKSPHHKYWESPWSANCVVFTGPGYDGMQPKINMDGPVQSWTDWKARRDATIHRPPTGVLLATEANDRFARLAADQSGALPAGAKWTREMVFLGYKYLVVLDRVTAPPGVSHRWTLHTINEPKVEGDTVVADNGPGRLFCKTLLPAAAVLNKVGGPGHEFDYNEKDLAPKGWGVKKFDPVLQLGAWRLDVTPAAQAAGECAYLHVLYPTDTQTAAMPACSVRQSGGAITVTVGEQSHTFVAPMAGAPVDSNRTP